MILLKIIIVKILKKKKILKNPHSPIFFFYQLYYTGTEQFNTKPIKGITFLQEQGLLSNPLDPGEVVTFLKENPRLDKAMIGEYVAKKSNNKVLEAFVK